VSVGVPAPFLGSPGFVEKGKERTRILDGGKRINIASALRRDHPEDGSGARVARGERLGGRRHRVRGADAESLRSYEPLEAVNLQKAAM
jgi:hypothetical protein